MWGCIMKKKTSEKTSINRRKMLKKVGVTSAFAVPTIVSFKRSALAVTASREFPGNSLEI